MLRQARYAFLANVAALLVNGAFILLLPKYMSVESYGYVQLYLFYSSYVGVLHLGIVDGMYLRYAGKSAAQLDGPLLTGQLLFVMSTQALWSGVIIFLATQASLSDTREIVWRGLAVAVLVTNVRFVFLFWLQAAGKFGHSSALVLIDRGAYLVGILALIASNHVGVTTVVSVDLVAKGLSLVAGVALCWQILKWPRLPLIDLRKEMLRNLRGGSKLLFANLAGLFIVGVVRFVIERGWSISVFGMVSLALAVATTMTFLLNAVGQVLLPFLRRSGAEKFAILYTHLGNLLTPLSIAVLVLYLPISALIRSQFPAYAPTIAYLGILLPLFLFEGRVALIINPYLKALRSEGYMFRTNLTLLGVSGGLALVMQRFVDDVLWMVVVIVLVLAVRSLLLDLHLCMTLQIPTPHHWLLLVVTAILFALCAAGSQTYGWALFSPYLIFATLVLLRTSHKVAPALRALRSL